MPPDAPPRLLDSIVDATATAGSADEILARAAELLLGRADWVVADRLEDPDLIIRVAGVDRDGPMPMPTSPGRVPARRSSAASIGLPPSVLRAPRHVLRLTRRQLDEIAADRTTYEARQAAAAVALGTAELVVIAMVRRGRVLGALSLGRREGAFSVADLAELGGVAAYLGVALDAARLYATQAAVATAVQTYLLPPVPAVAGLRLAARYEPAARGIDVGGDWYDAFAGSRGLTVVIGDTAGHDVTAAARMAELRNLLRGHAVDRDESPSEILARLDRTAFALQLDVLATCLVGHLEPVAGDAWRLTWSSAGHLPPVRVSAAGTELLETPADLMLGVDRHASRSDHVTDLALGDSLLLYTDGLIEVPGLPLDDRLELLRATVEGCVGCAPDELCDLLVGEFVDEAVDDVAMFALDIEARSAGA